MVACLRAYIRKEKRCRRWKGAITSKSGQNVPKSPSPVHFLTKARLVSRSYVESGLSRLLYTAVKPPSMTTSAPVMYLLSSEAR